MNSETDRGQPHDLEQFFELSLDLLCVAGADTYFRRVNPAFERTLGYSQQELLSTSFLDLIHEDDREATLREIEQLKQGKDVVQFENRYRCQDGSIRWLSWTCPAPSADDRLLYAVARDITAERTMQERLQLRTSILDSMHHSLAITTAETPDWPLIYVNPAFEKLTGYSLQDVLGRNCRFLQGEDRNQLPIQTMRNAVRDAESCRVLLRNYTRSGAMFWNEITLSPVLDQTGRLTHFVGFHNDVTDTVAPHLKQWEDISRQIEDLPPRQREVLHGLLAGRSIKQVASDIGISPKTAEMHRGHLFRKLNATDTVDLVRLVLTSAPPGHYSFSASAD